MPRSTGRCGWEPRPPRRTLAGTLSGSVGSGSLPSINLFSYAVLVEGGRRVEVRAAAEGGSVLSSWVPVTPEGEEVTVKRLLASPLGTLLMALQDGHGHGHGGLLVWGVGEERPIALLPLGGEEAKAALPVGGDLVVVQGRESLWLLDPSAGWRLRGRVREPAIKSMGWCQSGLVVYATANQLKFALPNGDAGPLCTLPAPASPLYLSPTIPSPSVGGMIKALGVNRRLEPVSVPFDSTEPRFKLALLHRDLPLIERMIGEGGLPGQAIIGYLREQGYAAIALAFVEDAPTRLQLALEALDWPQARLACLALAHGGGWEQLAEQALLAGEYAVALEAFYQARNWHRLLLVAACLGRDDLVGAIAGWARGQGDASLAIQARLLLPADAPLADGSVDLEGLLQLLQQEVASWPHAPRLEMQLSEEAKGKAAAAAVKGDGSQMGQPLGETEGWEQAEEELVLSSLEELQISSPSISAISAGQSQPQSQPQVQVQVQVPFKLAIRGRVEEAKEALQRQAGIVAWDRLAGLLGRVVAASRVATNDHTVALDTPLITLPHLHQRQEAAMEAVTAGRFGEAMGQLRLLLEETLMASLPTPGEEATALAMVEEGGRYLLALRLELHRRELMADSGEDNQLRTLQLAVRFCRLGLRPDHQQLALRSAMTLAYKLGCPHLAGRLARELLALSPPSALAQTAQKVLLAAERTSTPDALQVEAAINPEQVVLVDGLDYEPVKSVAVCGYCGSGYHEHRAGSVCAVCELAEIGVPVTGLRLH